MHITFRNHTVGSANYTLKDFNLDMARFVSQELLPKIGDKGLETVLRYFVFNKPHETNWVEVKRLIVKCMPEVRI